VLWWRVLRARCECVVSVVDSVVVSALLSELCMRCAVVRALCVVRALYVRV
jgi:hypothetical protein